VDETYVKVKGRWIYLYRAVDSRGQTIDFRLSAKRDAAILNHAQQGIATPQDAPVAEPTSGSAHRPHSGRDAAPSR
jgi:hypothetical protein